EGKEWYPNVEGYGPGKNAIGGDGGQYITGRKVLAAVGCGGSI
ncbi:hypothetical protein A2U01_0042276, partial [Trifolium medium]|nr:hypothetical protein [Trifolium medium]